MTSSETDTRCENPEYAAFARRIIRAAGRRIASGDPSSLKTFIDLGEDLRTAVETGVKGLRKSGFTWNEIAAGAEIATQTAHAKWRHLDEA